MVGAAGYPARLIAGAASCGGWLALASRDVRAEREGTDGAGRGYAASGGH